MKKKVESSSSIFMEDLYTYLKRARNCEIRAMKKEHDR